MSKVQYPVWMAFSIAKRFFISCKLSFFPSVGWHAVHLKLVLRPLGTCSHTAAAPTSKHGKAAADTV